MPEALSSPADPPRDEVADPLRAAIILAFRAQGDRDITDELREAVCAFVKARREAGSRAEEVVIAMKQIIDLTDLRHVRKLERRALTERVVTFCISQYYRAD